MSGRKHARKLEVISRFHHQEVTFANDGNAVVAWVHINENTRFGLQFNSAIQIMDFFVLMMEEAAKVCPESEPIKMYLEDE